MVCSCCGNKSAVQTQTQTQAQLDNGDEYTPGSHVEPPGEAMERGYDQQHYDDLKAVQWMRERSLEEHKSKDTKKKEKETKTTNEPRLLDDSQILIAHEQLTLAEPENLKAGANGTTETVADGSDGRKYDTKLELKGPTTPKGSQYTERREINIQRVVTDLNEGRSDVSSVTREQYAMACQLLQKRITQKKETMTNKELAFLQEILEAAKQEDIDEDRLSAVESATRRLDTDKLFELDSVIKTTTFPTPERKSITFQRSITDGNSPSHPSHSRQKSHDSQSSSLLSLESSQLGTDADAEAEAEAEAEPPLKRRNDGQNKDQGKQVKSELPKAATMASVAPISQPHRPDNTLDLLVQEDTAPSVIFPSEETSSDEEGDKGPYLVLCSTRSRLLRTSLMEALRGFLPFMVSEQNYWLKYSLKQDGASLEVLLHKLRASQHTLIVVESRGQIFGSFTSERWRKHDGWFGSGEAFLFRKTTKLEVYPFTNSDNLVQYCSTKMLCVGGGDFYRERSPWNGPTGIGLLLDGDLKGGESQSCATFCNPSLSKSAEFEVDDMEVWTFTPCMVVGEAEKLELHKLFVNEQRRG